MQARKLHRRVLSDSISLDISPREDGGVRVRSVEEPGLLLGGKDRDQVLAQIPAALKGMLEHNRGISIQNMMVLEDHVDFDYLKVV